MLTEKDRAAVDALLGSNNIAFTGCQIRERLADKGYVIRRKPDYTLPDITIDWDAIKADLLTSSCSALTEHLDRIQGETDHFIETKNAGWITDNCFSRSEMILIAALVKAARPALEHREDKAE